MNTGENISLVEYYASFKSTLGAFAGAISSVPLVSKALPASLTAYAFPPLGNVDIPARVGAVILCVAMTFLAFFSRASEAHTNRGRIVAAIVLAVFFLFGYICLFSMFVRTVDIPTMNSAVQVTVGYERTDFAKATFGTDSDWVMLRNRGTSDEEVERLWTSKSLTICKFSLYLTYCVFIFALVAAFSWGILEDSRRLPRLASAKNLGIEPPSGAIQH